MAEHFISREEAESDLLACAAYISEAIDSADGHAEAMSAVVPRYLENGDVDLAAELANTVDDPFTRDRLLIHVAEKCAQEDDDEYARQLVEAIEDPGLQAEGFERIGLLKAAKGQTDLARLVAEEMPHPEYVLAAIAVKKYSDGDVEGFNAEVKDIEFAAARVSAYTGVAHELVAAEKFDGVADLLERAAEDATEIEHEEERIRSLVEIGTLLSDAKENGRAIGVFDKAKSYVEELDNIHRDSFFAAISVGFLRAGSQDLADRTLDLVADKTQIATCLTGHARHFWNAGQKEDALESLEEAYAILKSQRDNETRNSRDRFRLFGSIAAQFALFDKAERSIEVAETIEDETENMTSLAQVATILTAEGKDELARRALHAIREDAQRTFALIGMSDAKAKLEQKEAALELLDEASHLAETVPQLASRASAYIELAGRFAKLDDDARLSAAIHNAFETVLEVRDESIKATSLAEIHKLTEDLELELGPEEVAYLRKLAAQAG